MYLCRPSFAKGQVAPSPFRYSLGDLPATYVATPSAPDHTRAVGEGRTQTSQAVMWHAALALKLRPRAGHRGKTAHLTVTGLPSLSAATTPSSTCSTRLPSAAVMAGARSSPIASANSSSSGTNIIVTWSRFMCGRTTVG
jgi:hypothetical protein